MRLAVFILCCFAVAALLPDAAAEIKKFKDGKKSASEVESSGTPPATTKETKKSAVNTKNEFEGSGTTQDDNEDGDVDEDDNGSGKEPEIQGSGEVVPKKVVIAVTSTSSTTTTTTTTLVPSIIQSGKDDDDDADDDDDDDEDSPEEGNNQQVLVNSVMNKDVKIEEQPPTKPTTPKQVYPPTIYDDASERRPFDPLLKPGVLAAVIGGAVVGVLATILLVMFIVYRMRKKDEGSYALEESKKQYPYAYQQASTNPKEFYA